MRNDNGSVEHDADNSYRVPSFANACDGFHVGAAQHISCICTVQHVRSVGSAAEKGGNSAGWIGPENGPTGSRSAFGGATASAVAARPSQLPTLQALAEA